MLPNPSLFRSRWGAAGAAALGAYFLFFFRLGGTPLLDPDEPVYGQVAREMVRTGQWLTPHLAGRPWFDKPPLFYWASAAAMSVFGPTELAARLPSALAAVLLALLVFALGRHFRGLAAGWAAAAVFATSLQTIILGRAAVTDMLFALTLAAALGGFALWYEGKGRALGWAALCGVALGLATLCKGPVTIVLLGLTALGFLVWERQVRRLLTLDAVAAIACCLLVAGPWYGAMLALNRAAFIGQFIDQNNLQRFARPEHAAGASPLYFVPVLLVGLFPWSLFLPRAAMVAGRGWAGRLLLTWSAVVFLFFSASHTKLVTYIYPLYPAVALLIGAMLARAGEEIQGTSDEERGTSVGAAGSHSYPGPHSSFVPGLVWATAGLGVLMAVGLIGIASRKYPVALAGAEVLGLVLVTGLLGSVLSAQKRRSPMLPYLAMMTAAGAALGGLIGPEVAPTVSLRDLALWDGATHRPLVAYHLKTPGFLFYAGRELPDEQEPADLQARARAVPGLAVAMSRRSLPEVEAATPDLDWRVIWSRGGHVVVEPVPRGLGSDSPGTRAGSPADFPQRQPAESRNPGLSGAYPPAWARPHASS